MSAIWGIVNFKHSVNESDADTLKSMYQPYHIDKYGKAACNKAIFGCGIQYITPESHKEKLPIYDNKTRILYTADCVLDNREELINELNLHNRDTKSSTVNADTPDGELMYQAYLLWNSDFTKHCIGAYTAAFYNEAVNELHIFTDHMCNRSLFYSYSKGCLIFSTLIVPLAKVTKATVCDQWIASCLATVSADMMLFDSLTPYKGIIQLSAARHITADISGLSSTEYWSPLKLRPNLKTSKNESYKDIFINTLQKSVASMMRSEKNTGCTLSGGLDSTSIAALASNTLSDSGKTLYSYTSVPHPDYIHDKKDNYYITNETKGVEALCQMHANIHPFYVDCVDRNPFSELERLIPLIGYPMKSGQNLVWLDNIYELASKNDCKIMLKGQYGNSTISYGPALGTFYQLIVSGHIKKAVNLMKGFSSIYNVPVSTIIKLIIKERIITLFPEKAEVTDALLSKKYIDEYKLGQTMQKLLKHCGGEQLDSRRNRLNFIWNPTAILQLSLFDTAMGLIHGILIRDPSKDMRVITMCCRFPVSEDLAGYMERGKIRSYMQGLVPDSILKDLSHRGLQSADYEYRCSLMWNRQAESIIRHINNPYLKHYVDNNRLCEFLKRINSSGKNESIAAKHTNDNLPNEILPTEILTIDDYRLANVLYSCALLLELYQ